MTENKASLTLILCAALVVTCIAMPRASCAAGCVSSFSINVSGKAEVCPVSGATANVSTAGTIGVPVSCPDAGNYVYHDYGSGGSSSQSGGGSGAPGQPSTINTGNPCECKKDCEQPSGCSGDHYCVGGKCQQLPESDNECKKYVCKSGEGFILENIDHRLCDDKKFCTSGTGEGIGMDFCLDGVCSGTAADMSGEDFTVTDGSSMLLGLPGVPWEEIWEPLVPDLQINSLPKIDTTEVFFDLKGKGVCCEDLNLATEDLTLVATGKESNPSAQISLDGIAQKLCSSLSEISGTEVRGCQFFPAISKSFKAEYGVTIKTDCCKKTIDGWYGGGRAYISNPTIENQILFEMNTPLGWLQYSETVHGNFDVVRSFSLSGSTNEETVSLNIEASFTVNFLGTVYTPTINYEWHDDKTTELEMQGWCNYDDGVRPPFF